MSVHKHIPLFFIGCTIRKFNDKINDIIESKLYSNLSKSDQRELKKINKITFSSLKRNRS